MKPNRPLTPKHFHPISDIVQHRQGGVTINKAKTAG